MDGFNLPFSSKSDDSPIALLVGFLLDLCAEADGTHDTITELLVQNGLVCITVVLDDLVESVNQRLLWWHLHLASTVRVTRELRFKQRLIELEDLSQVLDILWRGFGLSVEEGCDSDFFTSEGFGNGFEREVPDLLSLEKRRRRGREAGHN
jgi:hypothetical protein